MLDEQGRLLGTVTAPMPIGYVRPAVRGETLALVTSIDDVPAIVIYDIIRPDAD